jgi:hypothetical protein
MPKLTGTLYTIELHGYICPDGWPRVLAEMFVIGYLSKPPDEIANFPRSLGGGYGLTIRHIAPPLIPMKTETLARVRKLRLERRLEAKFPMFAEQFFAEEIIKKSEYYNGETRADIERERVEVLEAEHQRYDALMARPGQLIIYANEPDACKRKSEALLAEIADIRARHPPKEPHATP